MWWPEPGAEALTLERTSADSWSLSDVGGTVTTFVRADKDTDFPVADTAPPAAQGLARYVYQDVSGISRLHKIIAPVEPGVDGWPGNTQACLGTVPARGCEVLEFTYAGTGGGRVSRISAWSTNPGVDSATSKVDVAAFEYDATGRLTKAWDPRLGGVESTYTYDGAGRLVSMTPPGTVPWTFGYGPGGAKISGSGDLIDISAGRLLSVSRASLVPGSASELGPVNTTTVVYDVPLSRAAGGPYDLTGPAVATWGQRQAPTDATAVFGPQHVPAVTTATATVPGRDGYAPASVHYLDSSGWEVNLASPSAAGTPAAGFIDTAEYDRHGNVIRTLDASNRLLALGLSDSAAEALAGLGLSGLTSAQAALALDTRRVFFEGGVDMQAERGPVQRLAVAGDANNIQALHPVTRYRYDQGAPDGADYHLLTTTNVGSLPTSADLVTAALLDNVVTTQVYHPIDGASALGRTSGWVHRQPTRVTVDYGQPTATLAQVRYDEAGRVVESRGAGSTGADAATSTTLYYTAGVNAADAACGLRPEWAGSPCLTTAAGAITGHDPARAAGAEPRKRVRSYNRWGSVTEVVESATGPVGGVSQGLVRTTVTAYDAADRVVTVSTTGTGTGVGAPVEVTRSTYAPVTGDLVATETVTGGQVTATVSRSFDALGRLVGYTDAHGGTTTTTYDRYGRVSTETQTSPGVGAPLGVKTFVYDEALDRRGFVTSIRDSVAGTIEATWGPDGQLVRQVLPGGIALDITYDAAGAPVKRTYTRQSDGQLIWIDSVVTNHRGQWVRHSSTTGQGEYVYDRLGRVVETRDLLTSTKVCTTSGYTYDARSNRTAKTVVRGSDDGECMAAGSSGATTVTTVVDSADRVVTSAGTPWVHDPFGRVTQLRAGGVDVSNEFYVNDLVAAQEVAGVERLTWALDPLQRRAVNTRQEWLGASWVESATTVFHFASDGDEPAWVVEDATMPGSVTRYVEGVEGALAVAVGDGGLSVQLVDLHGDVVGTIPVASKDVAATWSGLVLARFDAFGAPVPLSGGASVNAPPRYGWLGAAQRSAEALGGVVLMGVRLYDPGSGRFLSPDPVPGGSATSYDYCNADPVNCTDLGGTFSFTGLLSAVAVVGEIASLIPGPVGAAAAGISAVAYAVQGNTAKAIEMGVTAAAALVGAGAVVRVAARAVGSAVKAGQTVARAAPRVMRTAGQRVASVLRRSGCNSFVAGTLVLLADGSLVPIEDLVRGDLVRTTDPYTGETSDQPVIATITGTGTKHLIAVVTDATAFTATAGHPIWVQAQGWTDAADLEVGDQLTGSGGQVHTITEVTDLGPLANQTVYNLSVSTTHTYYIATDDGNLDTLVHNAACPIGQYKGNIADGIRAHAEFPGSVRGLSPGHYVRGNGSRGFTDAFAGSRPVELKPDNLAALARGRRQLGRYENATGVQGQLWAYRSNGRGGFIYRRVS